MKSRNKLGWQYTSNIYSPTCSAIILRNKLNDSLQCSYYRTLDYLFLTLQTAPPIIKLVHQELPKSAQSSRLVVIRCQATGNPTPYVRWLKQNEHGSFVTEANISSWKMGSSTLLRTEHHGKYRCEARNALGQVYKDQIISK